NKAYQDVNSKDYKIAVRFVKLWDALTGYDPRVYSQYDKEGNPQGEPFKTLYHSRVILNSTPAQNKVGSETNAIPFVRPDAKAELTLDRQVTSRWGERIRDTFRKFVKNSNKKNSKYLSGVAAVRRTANVDPEYGSAISTSEAAETSFGHFFVEAEIFFGGFGAYGWAGTQAFEVYESIVEYFKQGLKRAPMSAYGMDLISEDIARAIAIGVNAMHRGLKPVFEAAATFFVKVREQKIDQLWGSWVRWASGFIQMQWNYAMYKNVFYGNLPYSIIEYRIGIAGLFTKSVLALVVIMSQPLFLIAGATVFVGINGIFYIWGKAQAMSLILGSFLMRTRNNGVFVGWGMWVRDRFKDIASFGGTQFWVHPVAVFRATFLGVSPVFVLMKEAVEGEESHMPHFGLSRRDNNDPKPENHVIKFNLLKMAAIALVLAGIAGAFVLLGHNWKVVTVIAAGVFAIAVFVDYKLRHWYKPAGIHLDQTYLFVFVMGIIGVVEYLLAFTKLDVLNTILLYVDYLLVASAALVVFKFHDKIGERTLFERLARGVGYVAGALVLGKVVIGLNIASLGHWVISGLTLFLLGGVGTVILHKTLFKGFPRVRRVLSEFSRAIWLSVVWQLPLAAVKIAGLIYVEIGTSTNYVPIETIAKYSMVTALTIAAFIFVSAVSNQIFRLKAKIEYAKLLQKFNETRLPERIVIMIEQLFIEYRQYIKDKYWDLTKPVKRGIKDLIYEYAEGRRERTVAEKAIHAVKPVFTLVILIATISFMYFVSQLPQTHKAFINTRNYYTTTVDNTFEALKDRVSQRYEENLQSNETVQDEKVVQNISEDVVEVSPVVAAHKAALDEIMPIRAITYNLDDKNLNLDDISKIAEAGFNTIRTFSPIDSTAALDYLAKYNLKVIYGFHADVIKDGTYLDYIERYKDHPAILMWEFGNELNYDRTLMSGSGWLKGLDKIKETNPEWFEFIKQAVLTGHPWPAILEKVAQNAKRVDPLHEVSTAHGEIPTAEFIRRVPSVDIWGGNIYRGSDAKSILRNFNEVAAQTGRVLTVYISETGTDSYHQTDKHDGYYDEDMQADTNVSIWNKTLGAAESGKMKNIDFRGITFHSFKDEWWKVKGGRSDVQDTNGVYALGAQPDNYFNEEYFGFVTIDGRPKKVFYAFKKILAGVEDVQRQPEIVQPKAKANESRITDQRKRTLWIFLGLSILAGILLSIFGDHGEVDNFNDNNKGNKGRGTKLNDFAGLIIAMAVLPKAVVITVAVTIVGWLIYKSRLRKVLHAFSAMPVDRNIHKKAVKKYGEKNIAWAKGEWTKDGVGLPFISSDFILRWQKTLTEELERLHYYVRAPKVMKVVKNFTIVITTDSESLRDGDPNRKRYSKAIYFGAADINEKIVYLHPAFFDIGYHRRYEILYHELISHMAKKIRNEQKAMDDTREFVKVEKVYFENEVFLDARTLHKADKTAERSILTDGLTLRWNSKVKRKYQKRIETEFYNIYKIVIQRRLAYYRNEGITHFSNGQNVETGVKKTTPTRTLENAIEELLMNAADSYVRAGRPGYVRIRVYERQGQVVVEVIDNGEGIIQEKTGINENGLMTVVSKKTRKHHPYLGQLEGGKTVGVIWTQLLIQAYDGRFEYLTSEEKNYKTVARVTLPKNSVIVKARKLKTRKESSSNDTQKYVQESVDQLELKNRWLVFDPGIDGKNKRHGQWTVLGAAIQSIGTILVLVGLKTGVTAVLFGIAIAIISLLIYKSRLKDVIYNVVLAAVITILPNFAHKASADQNKTRPRTKVRNIDTRTLNLEAEELQGVWDPIYSREHTYEGQQLRAFAASKKGKYDFSKSSGNRYLWLTFDKKYSGVKIRVRLLPKGADENIPVGVYEGAHTIGKDGVVLVDLRDAPLTQKQLRNIEKVTIHSGEVAWWKVLNDQHTAKTLNIYAVPEKIEVLKRDPLYKRFHVQKKTLQSIIALLTLAFLAGPAWAENVSEVVSKQLIDAGTGYLQSTAFVQMVFSVLQNASLTILLLAIFGITIIVGNFVKVSWKSSVVAGVALVVLGAGLLTTIEYSKNTTQVIIQQNIERIENPQERIRYAERHGLPVSDKDREQSVFMEIQKLEAASRFQCGGSCTEGQRVVQEVKDQGKPVLDQMKVCECVNGVFTPNPLAVIEEAYSISREKLGDEKETPSYKMTDPNLFYKEIIEEVERAKYHNPWEKRVALELLRLHTDALKGKSPSSWDRMVRSDSVLPGLSIFGFIPGILLMLWIWNLMLGRWERYRRLNAERTGVLPESRIPWRDVTFAIGVPLIPYLAFISFDYFGLLMSAGQFISYVIAVLITVTLGSFVVSKVLIERMIAEGKAFTLGWMNFDAALYRRLESALRDG
ncbi:MAG: hypothetical protein KC618_00415, partial [Candidatus Omnitrophica bacterium]|nr:hypothetical protein [Candidatus Omnitrophota bacterium]